MTSILIIDDHPDIREAIITWLEVDRPNWQIIVAENGMQGICFVNRYRPDLILVNGRMPILNGISTVEHLRNNAIPRNSRIIGMSGYPGHHPETVKMHAKCDAFLAKPFPPKMLIQTIDDTLKPIVA
jgi:CheY-like chemotaxis protein